RGGGSMTDIDTQALQDLLAGIAPDLAPPPNRLASIAERVRRRRRTSRGAQILAVAVVVALAVVLPAQLRRPVATLPSIASSRVASCAAPAIGHVPLAHHRRQFVPAHPARVTICDGSASLLLTQAEAAAVISDLNHLPVAVINELPCNE